jgi:hypothetical protein
MCDQPPSASRRFRFDLTGQRYGMLVVLAYVPSPTRPILWRCRCDCGTETTVAAHNLRSGNTSSCGCRRRDVGRTASRTHGMKGTPEHTAWMSLRRAVRASQRGPAPIPLDPGWEADFAAFYADLGPRPARDQVLLRTDPARGYVPGNCRWAARPKPTPPQGTLLLTHDGRTQTVAAWAAEAGLDPHTLRARLRRG